MQKLGFLAPWWEGVFGAVESKDFCIRKRYALPIWSRSPQEIDNPYKGLSVLELTLEGQGSHEPWPTIPVPAKIIKGWPLFRYPSKDRCEIVLINSITVPRVVISITRRFS